MAPDFVHSFQAMGGPCRVRLAGLALPAAHAACEAAEAEVRRIEAKYSRYREDSVVSRINAMAGQPQAVPVDDETHELLTLADALHAASNGLFDLTSGVLRHAWDFKRAALPDPALLREWCQRVGWQRVEREHHSIRLPDAGMELDLGGIGKEYACDRAAMVLHGLGAMSGSVNLGGDLRVLGPQPDGRGWDIAIQHPRKSGGVLASVTVSQGALATSGDYERFIEVNGQRFCHILDPRTGWPVSHWQSVSVLAPTCLAAGALATITMLKQAEGLDLLREEGVPFLIVGPHGSLIRHTDLEPHLP